MVSMLQRHAVQVLLAAGHTHAEVALLTTVSERTVRRIACEPPITGSAAVSAALTQSVGRPSKTAAFQEEVVKLLTDEPDLKTVEVLHRLRGRGYTGAKSAVYELVATVRPRTSRLLVRFEGVPGEFSQHDFGEVWVRFLDGRRVKVHFFASRLKYSRWIQVSRVPNQRVESLVRTLLEHFEAMGGVPLVGVFDRPTTIVVQWDKTGKVIQWNSTFAQAMLDMGIGTELCWPARGQEKGAVENLVGWVKGSFFKQRRFVDDEDLAAQLLEWLNEANHLRPSRATAETPAARMEAERRRLRPLKVTSDTLAMRYSSHVGPTAEVMFDGIGYSMPPTAIGLPATLYLYRSKLKIVAGRHSAEHERRFEAGAHVILPEHRAQQVAAVSGQRGKRYFKREQLLRLGAPALAFITELVHRREGGWLRDVEQLYDLLQAHGDAAMTNAFEEACRKQVFGAEYIRIFLTDPSRSKNGQVSE